MYEYVRNIQNESYYIFNKKGLTWKNGLCSNTSLVALLLFLEYITYILNLFSWKKRNMFISPNVILWLVCVAYYYVLYNISFYGPHR